MNFTLLQTRTDIISQFDNDTQLGVYQTITAYAFGAPLPEMTPQCGWLSSSFAVR